MARASTSFLVLRFSFVNVCECHVYVWVCRKTMKHSPSRNQSCLENRLFGVRAARISYNKSRCFTNKLENVLSTKCSPECCVHCVCLGICAFDEFSKSDVCIIIRKTGPFHWMLCGFLICCREKTFNEKHERNKRNIDSRHMMQFHKFVSLLCGFLWFAITMTSWICLYSISSRFCYSTLVYQHSA